MGVTIDGEPTSSFLLFILGGHRYLFPALNFNSPPFLWSVYTFLYSASQFVWVYIYIYIYIYIYKQFLHFHFNKICCFQEETNRIKFIYWVMPRCLSEEQLADGKELEICTTYLKFKSGGAPLVRAWDSRDFTRSPGPTKYVFQGMMFPRIQKKIKKK
jgi:hypothetical protein